MAASNAKMPPEAAMDEMIRLVHEAEMEGCVVVHRLSVERGHTKDQQYVATEGEKPWHDLIFKLWQVKDAAEKLRRAYQLQARGVDAEAIALRHSQSHEDAEGGRDRV